MRSSNPADAPGQVVALVGSAIVDLHSRPWSNNMRCVVLAWHCATDDPPVDCPSYAEVMLWHADLAAEVQDRIGGGVGLRRSYWLPHVRKKPRHPAAASAPVCN